MNAHRQMGDLITRARAQWAVDLTQSHARRTIAEMEVIHADEGRAAAVVAAGDPGHEIAMLGMPPMVLGALQSHEAVLSDPATSAGQKRAAAEILLRSSHRPHRITAGLYLGACLDT